MRPIGPGASRGVLHTLQHTLQHTRYKGVSELDRETDAIATISIRECAADGVAQNPGVLGVAAREPLFPDLLHTKKTIMDMRRVFLNRSRECGRIRVLQPVQHPVQQVCCSAIAAHLYPGVAGHRPDLPAGRPWTGQWISSGRTAWFVRIVRAVKPGCGPRPGAVSRASAAPELSKQLTQAPGSCAYSG